MSALVATARLPLGWTGMRPLRPLLLVLLLWLAAPEAAAYPQYVGRGEFNCQDCHYSPTGGGLVNSWGRQSREVFFGPDAWGGGSLDMSWGHGDASGRDARGQNHLEFDLGADARVLALVAPAPLVVPMLSEVGAVAGFGNFQAYATVTARLGTPGLPLLAHSREHWLMYRAHPELSVRAGRLVLPFGLRMADHTVSVREDFGFDKWDQSYALEVDWTRDDFTLVGAGFVGDLLLDAGLRERGGAVRGSYVFAQSLEIAVSAILAKSTFVDRTAESVSLRWDAPSKFYLLAELALQQRSNSDTEQSADTLAAFGRLGYFATGDLDLFAEGDYRQIGEDSDLTRSRVGLGANWQLWHWAEVVPQTYLETQAGLGTQFVGMLQAHLMY